MEQKIPHLCLTFLKKSWLNFRLSSGHKNCFCIPAGHTWDRRSEGEVTIHVYDFLQTV